MYSSFLNSIIILIILIASFEFIENILGFIFPSGFKHVFLFGLTSVVLLVKKSKTTISKKYFIALLILFFIATYTAFINNNSSLKTLQGAFFTLLFSYIFIVFSRLKFNNDQLIYFLKKLLIVLILLITIAPIEAIVTGTTLRWAPGIFREAGALAAAINITIIISLSLSFLTKRNNLYINIAIILSVIILITTLKKSIIENLLIWFIYLIYSTQKVKLSKIILPFIFVGIVFNFFVLDSLTENINENINYLEESGAEGHVRIGMFIAAFNIAKDFFPFGSGLGTFVSLPSINDGYSQLYYDYGVAYIGSNSELDVSLGHHTLLDTFWPHIIGELGFFGTMIYIFLMFFPIISLKSYKFYGNLKGFKFYIYAITIMFFLEGFVLFSNEIPLFIIFHSLIVGILYSNLFAFKEKKP